MRNRKPPAIETFFIKWIIWFWSEKSAWNMAADITLKAAKRMAAIRVCQNGLFTQFILIKGFCRWKSENSLICSTTVWTRLSQFFKPNREQQPDPLDPFCEIGVCVPPLAVPFPWTWDPRDQLQSHAGHTSVTQTLTKRHESLESKKITRRWWLTTNYCFS